MPSLAKRMTNQPQKGRGYVHVTNFCMCNLEKNSPRHAVTWDQQGRRRITVCLTFDIRR